MMVSEGPPDGRDARFVRARRASNAGRRSRGPSVGSAGSSVNKDRSGRIADVRGIEPEAGNNRDGSVEMRMRASA